MAYIIAIVIAIAVIWLLLMFGLKKMSDCGYPPEIKFPETEWPDMERNKASSMVEPNKPWPRPPNE